MAGHTSPWQPFVGVIALMVFAGLMGIAGYMYSVYKEPFVWAVAFVAALAIVFFVADRVVKIFRNKQY